jgi:hypothetical protein
MLPANDLPSEVIGQMNNERFKLTAFLHNGAGYWFYIHSQTHED